MAAGMVLVLDGPSSVGRSTTLTALQERWSAVRSGPLLVAGLAATRRQAAAAGDGRWADLFDRVEPSTAGRPPRFRYGPLGRTLIAGMHRSAAAWARAGVDVALDHCIVDGAMLADLERACADVPLVIVGLTCDPVVLDAREADRDDVVPGRSAAERAAVLGVAHRDVVDTTAATTDEVVDELVALLRVSRT